MTADPGKRRVRGLILRAVGAFILANVLLLYLPVSPAGLAVLVVIASVAMLLDHRKILPLAISLLFATLLLEGVVRVGAVSALTPYYRPHEALALETSYQPNRELEMDVPHGDLLTIDPTLPKALAQPRRERFVTDSNGYRNEIGYSRQLLVTVGDSFLVGTQTTLTGQIQERHRIPAYNVSFSGMGPLIYAEKVVWARQQLQPDCCIVLFFFEGNDFRPVNATELAARDAIPRGFQKVVKAYVQGVRGSSEWSKTFYGLLTRTQERFRAGGRAPDGAAGQSPAAAPPRTFVRAVGGKPMAFLAGYAEVARRTTFEDHEFIRSRLAAATPDMVVFIPEKYRVYSSLLDETPEANLPHAQWAYLKSAADELGIPALDLTPALIERSRELLKQDQVTYWRDDTHWNRHGEDVAADMVVTHLRGLQGGKCAKALGH
jgi:hypothetical protein